MKIKFEKIMAITSELLSYCHSNGAKEFHLDISESDDAIVLTMRACLEHMPDKEMERLHTALSAPRQREIEQDYWELIGESETHSEMTLVGMLCDETAVQYRDNELSITLKRYA
ncbi:MAG: hypothetical protein FWC75_03455 [Oscillospiraceae bacterium]|nr:hypothetical protein [Oscillospiraceae bacterium]